MPPQIIRLLLLTTGILLTYAGARWMLTPKSYGQFGPYRGAALQEAAAREPVFAGKSSCVECHSDLVTKFVKFEHKTIACESCHGHSQPHVGDPDKPTPVKWSDAHCLRCHENDPAKPAWFHQVKAREHYTGTRCTECHLPHQPKEVP